MAPKLESWLLDTRQTWVRALVWSDHIVAQTSTGVLAAWRVTEDGGISSLWRKEATGSAGPMCLDAEQTHVVVAINDGSATRIVAYDLAHGDVTWETRVDGEAQTLFDANDETWVFFGDEAAVVSDGAILAQRHIDVRGVWAIPRSGTVDVWSTDRYVCLSPAPTMQWIARKHLDGAVESVAFSNEYTAARQIGGKTLRLFRRFDPIWGQTVHGPGRLGEVRLDEVADQVFVALTTGEVVAWELSTGEALWQSESRTGTEELHVPLAPVLIDDFVIAPMRSGYIAILDRSTGQVLGETAATEHLSVAPMGRNRFVTTGSSLRVYRLSA